MSASSPAEESTKSPRDTHMPSPIALVKQTYVYIYICFFNVYILGMSGEVSFSFCMASH